MKGILFIVAFSALAQAIPGGFFLLMGGLFVLWIYQIIFEEPTIDYDYGKRNWRS